MYLVFILKNSFDLKYWAEIPEKLVLFSAIQCSCDFPQPHRTPGLNFSVWELNDHFNNLLFTPFPTILYTLSLWFFSIILLKNHILKMTYKCQRWCFAIGDVICAQWNSIRISSVKKFSWQRRDHSEGLSCPVESNCSMSTTGKQPQKSCFYLEKNQSVLRL